MQTLFNFRVSLCKNSNFQVSKWSEPKQSNVFFAQDVKSSESWPVRQYLLIIIEIGGCDNVTKIWANLLAAQSLFHHQFSCLFLYQQDGTTSVFLAILWSPWISTVSQQVQSPLLVITELPVAMVSCSWDRRRRVWVTEYPKHTHTNRVIGCYTCGWR